MIEGTELPRIDTNTAASAIPEIDMMMSRSRITTSDTAFLLTAAMAPMIELLTSAMSVAPKPMISA